MARQNKSLIKRIETAKNRIAAERDKLRDMISDLEDIAGGSDDAVQSLEHAADALSRLL